MSRFFAGHGRSLWMSIVGFCVWAGANLLALDWINRSEAKAREREYGVSDEVVDRFAAGTVRVPNDGINAGAVEMNYRLMEPHPVRDGRSYPVVVYLHGSGERGNDNVRQLRSLPTVLSDAEMRKRFPCFLIVPQCPSHRAWGRADQTADADNLDAVMTILDDVLRHPQADLQRVYLTGFSMGGFGAWELAARHPERFAAVVPVAGGGDPMWGERLAKLPIWAVHGMDDTVVPASGTREMVAAIRAAGGTPKFLKLPGVGHAAWQPAFSDSDEVLTWLFQQIKPDERRVIAHEADQS